MPYINTTTTKKMTDEDKASLTRSLGEAITLIPGKSEEWLMLNFTDGQTMAFRGKEGNCCIMEVSIFGKADAEAYDALTARLCEIAHDHLGIPEDRTYVKYTECSLWGWNGINF